MKTTSAYIIAGGKSSRFGQDKSLYEYEGKPLIQHVYDTIKDLFQDIYIISDDREKFDFLDLEVFPDLIPDFGPVAGVYTAISNLNNNKAFAFACDTPSLNPELIEYMMNIRGDHDVIVPFPGGNYEPLHAIYTKNCLDPIKNFIKTGNRKLYQFVHTMDPRKVSEDEIEYYDNPDKIFRNVNRIEDI